MDEELGRCRPVPSCRFRGRFLDGHVEGVDDEVGVLGAVDRPAHDLPGERVHDCVAVHLCLLSWGALLRT